MSRRITIIWALVLLNVVATTGCGSSLPIKQLHGVLIYSAGGEKIKKLRFPLSGTEPKLLYQSEQLAFIRTMTRYNDRAVIFEECPITSSCRLKFLNLETGETHRLFPGFKPTFVMSQNSLLYLQVDGYGNVWLYAREYYSSDNYSGLKKLAKVADQSILQQDREFAQPVPVSRYEVIFLKYDGSMHKYNFVTDRVEPLSMRNHYPVMWHPKSETLLCRPFATQEKVWQRYFINLKTQKINELKAAAGASGWVALHQMNGALVTKSGYRFPIGEKDRIYYYSFNADRMEYLRDGTIETGVWLNREGDRK